jgi:hypothetical protein
VTTNPATDQSTPTAGERRPVAMTPYAIGVALFAAFVIGGVIAKSLLGAVARDL